MTDHGFYVENAALLGHGLARLGTQETVIGITGDEGTEALAGKLLGMGLHKDRQKNLGTIASYTHDEHGFVRRCAYMGLSLAGYLDPTNHVDGPLLEGFFDDDIEVRKAAIIGYGWANLGKGDSASALEGLVRDPEWKIRAAAGLAFSAISLGNPTDVGRFVNLLESEESPYVKVCSCWYVSTAFATTLSGRREYAALLARSGEQDSFFRDMACLGLGLSFLGTQDPAVDSQLETTMQGDPHPYVRESACFGLALNHFQKPTPHSVALLQHALGDSSSIVRSGAALGLGLTSMGLAALPSIESDDASVLWGRAVSRGLAGEQEHDLSQNAYIRWGQALGDAFRPAQPLAFETQHTGAAQFQLAVNEGLIGSGIDTPTRRSAFRLAYPGLHHYLVFDSFWWGLWVMTALGTSLQRRELK